MLYHHHDCRTGSVNGPAVPMVKRCQMVKIPKSCCEFNSTCGCTTESLKFYTTTKSVLCIFSDSNCWEICFPDKNEETDPENGFKLNNRNEEEKMGGTASETTA